MKKILYIGNNLTQKFDYSSAMDTLSAYLLFEGFELVKSSSKQNKILRLFSMCIATFKYRRCDWVLIDVFSTSNFYYALIISQLCRLFNLKYITILHGGNLPDRFRKSFRYCNLIFRNAKINITPSNYLYDFFKDEYNCRVIPNILEIERYEFRIREKFAPNLLWVRAFDKIYNPILAIEVFKQVRNKYQNANLTMIGPFKDNSIEEVKEKLDELKLNSYVTITGAMANKDWLNLSKDFDIFLNTTTVDNMPVSIIEAMALGLPVVTTNVGGIPYLLNSTNGWLSDNKNKQQMVENVLQIIENPDTALHKVISARKLVENYSWKSVKSQWFEVLNE